MSKKEKKRGKNLLDTDNSVGLLRGGGVGGGGRGFRKVNGGGRRPDLGWRAHSTATDDVLWSHVPETCIILLTSVTSINSIKRKKEKF